jgi:hypothetical protein
VQSRLATPGLINWDYYSRELRKRLLSYL